MGKTNEIAWEFVEKYYPNYSSCDDIARNEDLYRLIHKEQEEGDDADTLLQAEYNGDLNSGRIIIDYHNSLREIYARTIVAFINKSKEGKE